jgi:type VI protein secretion system component Hcp
MTFFNFCLYCDIHVVSKRYKIQGTSFTTNSKKWFEFSEYEWQEFKHRQWTHYPAWSFDSSTITEF